MTHGEGICIIFKGRAEKQSGLTHEKLFSMYQFGNTPLMICIGDMYIIFKINVVQYQYRRI